MDSTSDHNIVMDAGKGTRYMNAKVKKSQAGVIGLIGTSKRTNLNPCKGQTKHNK